jgi:sugar porter (SP) family MFS transporter
MKSSRTAARSSYVTLISMVAAIAGILFGFDTGIISGAILFINNQFHLSALLNGTLVSAVLFGALIGAIFSGKITDHYGRKMILISVALVFALGTLLTSLAPNLALLIIGRFVVGLAIGLASYAAPLYISEIAPPQYRGALVSLNQLAISIGILLSYVVDYLLAAAHAWRLMLGMGILPAILLLIGMIFLPRSPRWMFAKGHHSKAAAILRRIRGGDRNIDHELSMMRDHLNHMQGSWRILFSKTIRPVVFIGAGLAILQQVTGINTILYYAPTILKTVGYGDSGHAILATMGVGGIFVLFTIVSLPLIDIVGRRKLLIVGLLGMALGLAIMIWSFHHTALTNQQKYILLAGLFIYIAAFAFSLGPIMWLMISEIYPLKVRGIGASFATCLNWASNMIVAFTFLTIVKAIGIPSTFTIYLIMCFVSIAFVVLLVPETKGILLEQIEVNLLEGKKWRHLGDSFTQHSKTEVEHMGQVLEKN